MAVADKKGRMHHSAGRAALQDEMDERDSKKGGDGGYSDGGKKDGAAAAPKKDGADDGEAKTDVSHMEIGEVVKKHGPAHHVVISHDDDNAVHSVTSHHGKPAHMHHAGMGSREDAAKHANMAQGMEEEDEENATPGDEMNAESEGEEMGRPSSKIPGMATA